MVDYTINDGDILVEMDKPKLNAWNTISVTFTAYNHIKYVAGDSRTGVVPGQTITVLNDFVPKDSISYGMQAIVSELRTVERQNYIINVDDPNDIITFSLSATVGEFKTTEVNYISYNAGSESVSFAISSIVSELQTIQSGDVPV